jgi:anaerobic ribonucleoside-triphosphate reductase
LASDTQQNGRICPHCGSDDTTLTQRGLAGATDTHDQYFVCGSCGKVTYEIVSRTPKEIRINRLEPGRQFRHEGADYIVSRVLKVGLNESLVYVKPAPASQSPTTRLPRLRR